MQKSRMRRVRLLRKLSNTTGLHIASARDLDVTEWQDGMRRKNEQDIFLRA
jgi:hypothetical protein